MKGMDMDRSEWAHRSACAGKPTEYWFGDADSTLIGLVYCKACEAREECLKEAMTNGEKYGIWGGMTPKQRYQLANRKGPRRGEKNGG